MSFKSATSVKSATPGDGFDPDIVIPSGTLEGDALVVLVGTSDNSPDITPTGPSGWTLQAAGSMPVDGTGAASNPAVWIYLRDDGASADDETNAGTGTYLWTFSGAASQFGMMINADPATWGQFAKNELTGNRTTINAPAVTTTDADELVFHCALKDDSALFSGFPSGTQFLNITIGTGAGGGAFGGVHAEFGIGDTGVKAFTHASNESNGFTFSLAPTAAPAEDETDTTPGGSSQSYMVYR